MTNIEIEYCVPCGHLPRAIDLQRDLLEEFGLDVDGVRLKTGDSGVFKVRIDDDLVYDKSEDGDLDVEELEEEIRTRAVA